MGLITKNYEVKNLGVTLDSAYAQISSVNVDEAGNAFAMFKIQGSREDIAKLQSLEYKNVEFKADKNGKIFEQAYNAAKEVVFAGWEDDIVE